MAIQLNEYPPAFPELTVLYNTRTNEDVETLYTLGINRVIGLPAALYPVTVTVGGDEKVYPKGTDILK